MIRVFVSSTSIDLKDHRSAVLDAVMTLGMHPVMMEHFPAMDATALEACKQKVLDCDLFVGIYAHRYGYIPQGQVKSITELEYDWAAEAGMPRHVFVIKPDYPWPNEFREPPTADLLAAFKERVGKERVWSYFTTPDSLVAKVTQSLIHDAQQTIRRDRRQRALMWSGAAVAVVAIIAAALVMFNALAPQPVTPTATPAPQRLPAGFNVIVAGFGMMQNGGTLAQSPETDDISDIIYAALSEMSEIDHLAGWRAPGVGHLLASDANERRQQAEDIAQKLNADVVIYGTAEVSGLFVDFRPEFHISAEFAALEPELSGSETFGEVISMLIDADSDDLPDEVQTRVTIIRAFLRGLALYIQGKFTDSREAFETAIAVQPHGMEALYVFAGNAALREGDTLHALELYTTALDSRPRYARALGGRGIALFRLAVDTWTSLNEPYDPDLTLPDDVRCANSPPGPMAVWQVFLALAEVCYIEALNSPDTPAEADMDVKLSFALGELTLWRATVGGGGAAEKALEHLIRVIELYEASDPARQARIRTLAAQANALLGRYQISTRGNDSDSVTAAIAHYRAAVELLKNDVNRDYNREFIENYTERIAALEKILNCDSELPLRLAGYTFGQVISSNPPTSLTLHTEPGGDISGEIPEGTTFIVSDGPECTDDGISWWYVSTLNGEEGWLSEGSSGQYFVEPKEFDFNMGMACPYVFTFDGERWRMDTTILYNLVGPENEAQQVRRLQRFDGRLWIREIEPETSYIDHLFVRLLDADGRVHDLYSFTPALQASDGDYVVLDFGDALLLEFADLDLDVEPVAVWVVAEGYYEPY